ncbi:MAG TPA: L-seryl-tRNA(Sec) selenium transferase [Candidatus Krumholzibacteria bacterium]|nr:L-seryl-tRNA(Sec) selenium transferase [Candidatus Krumholzibacteria bacterium]
MTRIPGPELLRAIPSVDELLATDVFAAWRGQHPRFPWTRFVRAILDDLREGRLDAPAGADRATLTALIAAAAAKKLDTLRTGGLRPVLNGTGVILHTNLGRAPLGEAAVRAGEQALRGYVSLEVDLESGERSRRGDAIEPLFALLCGTEAAMVVNNNAAAVYLVANSFSPPGRILVSRGELVEIGGSFRLPEILRHAAASVIEVGTTNRTYAADYERVAQPGDVLLKVHKSNYEIEGFAHEATVNELVEVGKRCDCRVVFDLGSGALFDFAGAGVGHEPVVTRVIETGVDAVTMSGDKLLGAAQAGIIVGRRAFIDRLKQNPLRRVVRIDKVAVAVLQTVAREYLFAHDPKASVPVLSQITAGAEALAHRANTIADALHRSGVKNVGVAPDDAAVGGGSFATTRVASVAITIACASDREAAQLARRLRLRARPLFTRVKGSELRVNLSTIFAHEDEALSAALVDTLTRSGA